MFIYRENNHQLEVYEVYGDPIKIANYKKGELVKFEKAGHELVYTLKNFKASAIFEEIKEKDYIGYSQLHNTKKYREWSELQRENLFNECIKRQYIIGKLNDNPVVKVVKDLNDPSEVLNYFLGVEKCFCPNRNCHLNSFINLPENLYYLQLFELGRDDYLLTEAKEELINEILSMYTANQTASYDISALAMLHYQGLANNIEPIITHAATYSNEILRRIRAIK